jgi:xanthine dehydrogenase YagT iron-sulfur-binding subunit
MASHGRKSKKGKRSQEDRRGAASVEEGTSEAFECNTDIRFGISRRHFVKTVGGIAIGGMTIGMPILSTACGPRGAAADNSEVNAVSMNLTINGQKHALTLDPRVTLLDLLRENLGLTGTKKGCDHGQCGACTVLAAGRRINSCLSLAVVHDGDEVTTIEGIGSPEGLHPLQEAFIESDGFQCGYCTPGQICSAIGMLAEVKRGDASFVTVNMTAAGPPATLTAEEIRERMSGNICRCGAYPGILQAIQSVYRA